ncbi:MAG: autotransporter-associated beta strand repeat-containing protein, partial [Pirellulales bacterium]|nr:autotransporter-associated beta strand repeat-containing protein [Pirellulales bacterium]
MLKTISAILLLVGLMWATPASAIDYYWGVVSGNVNDFGAWLDSSGGVLYTTPGSDPADKVIINNGNTATITAANQFAGSITSFQVGSSDIGGAGPGEGHIIQTGGDVSVTGARLDIGFNGAPGTSTYDLQGGSLNSNGYYARIGYKSKGIMTISNSAWYNTNSRLYVGDSTDGDGELHLLDSASVSAGSFIRVSIGTNTNGLLTMKNNATLAVPKANYDYSTDIGSGTGASGEWTMEDYTAATIDGERMYIGTGSGASGELSLSGNASMIANLRGGVKSDNTAANAANLLIGHGGGTGTVSLTGNASMSVINNSITYTHPTEGETTVNARTYIGTGAGSNGTLNMSGNSTMTISTTTSSRVGDNGSNDGLEEGRAIGTINLSGGTGPEDVGAKLTYSGGAVHFGIWDNSQGNLNIHDYAEFVAETVYFGDNSHDTNITPGEGNLLVDGHGKLTLSGTLAGGSFAHGVGNLTLTDYAVADVNGHLYIAENGGTSTVNLNLDSTMDVDDNLRLGYKSAGTGVLNVNGTSEMTVGGASRIGYLTATGTVNVNDSASLSFGGWIRFGDQGTGYLNLNGGTFASNGTSMFVGSYDGTGYMNVHNAAQATIEDLQVGVNWQDGTANLGIGTVTVDGADAVVTVVGAGTHQNDDSHTFQNTLTIGAAGGQGTWNQNAGLTTCANTVILGEYDYYDWDTEWTPGQGTLNLNGGTFACGGISTRSDSAVITGTTATINFDGGTLKALASNSNFLAVDDVAAATMTINVKAGGAIIDTNGFDIGTDQALVEDGSALGTGLTKLGAGTLTLGGANTYLGATAVNAGELRITGSITSNVTVDATAALSGNGGTITGNATVDGTFLVYYNSDSDTVDMLTVDGLFDLSGGA